MSRILVVALSVLFVALPVQAATQADTKTITVRLISTTESSKTLVDRAPKLEASRGDVILVSSLLRNAVAQFGQPKGAFVGSDNVVFTVVTTGRQADVRVETSLPGGTLEARGRTRLGRLQTYPVTSGTGKFVHARGTGESRALGPSGNRRLKVYRLRLP